MSVDESIASAERERTPPRTWASVLWAISPTLIVLPCVLAFGRQWPYLGWLGFFAGALNMYAWSAMALWSRRVEHWEIRAVPLTLLMLIINAALLIAGEALLAAIGVGGSASAPGATP